MSFVIGERLVEEDDAPSRGHGMGPQVVEAVDDEHFGFETAGGVEIVPRDRARDRMVRRIDESPRFSRRGPTSSPSPSRCGRSRDRLSFIVSTAHPSRAMRFSVH